MPRRRARPGRLRPLRQAHASGTTTPTNATWTGCRRGSKRVDLTDITLVCQDWGGARSACASPPSIPTASPALVVANTGMPTGDQAPTEAFLNWQNFSQTTPVFPIGMIINGGTVTDLSDEVIAALRRAVPRRDVQGRRPPVPASSCPRRPTTRRAAAQPRGVEGVGGVRQAGAHRVLRQRPDHQGWLPGVPGARAGRQGQPHTTIEGGGHFLQEDRGPGAGQGRARLHRVPRRWPTPSLEATPARPRRRPRFRLRPRQPGRPVLDRRRAPRPGPRCRRRQVRPGPRHRVRSNRHCVSATSWASTTTPAR